MDFADEITHWYQLHKRDLPWRQSTDPYVIWLSEIILQQTRVDQGKPYFYRFLEKYPDVSAFANATEEEILKLWQGLGYYSRARNMLKTAQFIQREFNGNFPGQYSELIKLKGVGEYTAAAIASFAANEPKAVVDGNVYRILARWFGIEEPVNSTKGKKTYQQIADRLLNPMNPGLHNQAMMEFGALMCKPKNPGCIICPVNAACYAFNHQVISRLPVKLKKNKIRERFFNYFVILDDQHIILKKRGEKDIWANMYDFPLFESTLNLDVEKVCKLSGFEKFLGKSKIIDISLLENTMLTHQKIFYRFIYLKMDPKQIILPQDWFLVASDGLEKYPTPKIVSQCLNKIFIL